MRTYWTFFLLLLTFLACLPGCRNTKDQENEIKLVAWITYKGHELEEFSKLVARFCKKYKKEHKIKVNIIAKQVPFDDLTTNIKMACLSNKTPDIARLDSLKVLELAYHKVLVPLDKLEEFKKEGKTIQEKGQEFMPGPYQVNVVETKNLQGKLVTHLYGLPEQATCLALFWNKEMFREVGEQLKKAGLDPKKAPATWQELIQYSKILTRKVGSEYRYGFAMNNSLWWTFPFFGVYETKFVVTKNGKKVCTLGDDASVKALQLKVDLYQKYKIEAGAWKSGAIGPDVGFINEKYAMIFMGPWKVKDFQKKGLDFGVSLIPGIKGKIKTATNVGGNSLVIFRSSKHQEVAYCFLKFMTSCETQVRWCQSLKQIPVNRKAAKILAGKSKDPRYADIKVDPIIAMFMEQIKYAVPPPPLPRYAYIEGDVINPEMELALKKEKTVKKALLDSAKKINDHVLSLVNE